MKSAVAIEIANSVKLARSLNLTGLMRRRFEVLMPNHLHWIGSSTQSFEHARWWIRHAKDLKQCYGDSP